ncbi:hypothetical protein SynSYN20_02532 [Synechococcus sp. SYN20]|nr:hypothetical protein SynSYN20_02532 [Synechococcus sp. SYN20]
MIQKGMNAHQSVQANKIILLNNLKKTSSTRRRRTLEGSG